MLLADDKQTAVDPSKETFPIGFPKGHDSDLFLTEDSADIQNTFFSYKISCGQLIRHMAWQACGFQFEKQVRGVLGEVQK